MFLLFVAALHLAPARAEPHAESAAAVLGGPTLRSGLLKEHFYFQGELPLCAFFTEKAFLEAYLGRVLPAEELFAWYAATGTFDVEMMGVPANRVGDALKVKGLTVREATLTKETLRSALTSGYAVMAIVNPAYYWTPDDPMLDFWVDLQRRRGIPLASHLVWVTDARSHFVVLNDSALYDGAARSVDWAIFTKSWSESGYRAFIVPKVLPPLDPNRDGVPLVDADDDGDASVRTGGLDCDDSRSTVHPGAEEVPYNSVDEDCVGGDLADVDGDGYTWSGSRGGDCDDANPSVHPGAEELCYDGVDSDCAPDDRDRDCDGDGALLPPAGGDCDDQDSKVGPGAREVCDGVDNDCDGATDGSDRDLVATAKLYVDADGDGFGASSTGVGGCREDQRPGLVLLGGDCDDESAEVNPEVEESCDGRDNNCDGRADDADPALVTGHLCYVDSDGDGRGRHGSGKPACECPAGWVDRGFDCDDTDPTRGVLCE